MRHLYLSEGRWPPCPYPGPAGSSIFPTLPDAILLERGLSVILLDPWVGFQIDAQLEYDEEYHLWVGVPVSDTRYLVPAYWLSDADVDEVIRLLRSQDPDGVLDLVQVDERSFRPWDEAPWWLSRDMLGDIVQVLRL